LIDIKADNNNIMIQVADEKSIIEKYLNSVPDDNEEDDRLANGIKRNPL
jgi:hypothetical protein